MIEVDFNLSISSVFGEKKYEKWLKTYPIINSKEVSDWIESKMIKFADRKKDPTKFQITAYLAQFQDYCSKNDASPQELLNEPLKERDNRLTKYLNDLLNEGKNEATVTNAIQAKIKSYYAYHGKNIKYQMLCSKVGTSGAMESKIAMIPETTRRLLKHLNPQYQLLVKFQALCGLRFEDCTETLRSGNYKFEKHKDHYFIRNVKTNKRNKSINFLFIPIELEGTFKAVFGVEDLTKIDLQEAFTSKQGNGIDLSNYNRILLEALNKIGITDKSIGSHTFRKMFRTMIDDAQASSGFKEYLMTHETNDLTENYLNKISDIEMFYKEWLKVEPFLHIETEFIDKTDEEVIKLREELAKEKARNEAVTAKLAKENYEMKEKFTELEKEMLEFKELFKKFVQK